MQFRLSVTPLNILSTYCTLMQKFSQKEYKNAKCQRNTGRAAKSFARRGADPDVHRRIWSKLRLFSPIKSIIFTYIDGTDMNTVQAFLPLLCIKMSMTSSGEKWSSIITPAPVIKAVWSAKQSPWTWKRGSAWHITSGSAISQILKICLVSWHKFLG